MDIVERDFIIAFAFWFLGVATGYLWFAPETPFKRGFIKGFTLQFWRKAKP